MAKDVSSSVKLLLLQSEGTSKSQSRDSELAAVLASLNSEGEDCGALLRRNLQLRQADAGVEEELALAEEALHQSRGSNSVWEIRALCAVAEAHLGVEDQRQALRFAQEALALSRERRQEEVQALVTVLKCRLDSRELLGLWRQLGASWGDVARQVCRTPEPNAEQRARTARESEQRWPLAAALSELLRPQMPQQILEELVALTPSISVEAEEAWQLLEAGNCSEARRLAALALKRLREAVSSNYAAEALALLVLSRTSSLMDREEEAFEAAMEALHLSRQSAFSRGEAWALKQLAQMGRGAEAILQLSSEAGRLFCDLDERRAVGSLLSLMSSAHAMLHASEEALLAARDSLATLREEGCKVSLHAVEEAKTLLALGKAQEALHQPQALASLEESVALIRGLEDLEPGLMTYVKSLEAEVLLVLVELHLGRGALDEALRLAEACRRERGPERLRASALRALARVHIARKEPESAKAAAQEALSLQELRDGDKEALQLLVNAELASNSGKAMETAKRAVEKFEHSGDRKNQAMALQQVARTHMAKLEFLRAARVAKEAQAILAELKDTEGEIEMLQTAVEAHLARPEAEAKDDALQCILDALAEFRRRGNLRGQALGLSVLARTYVKVPEPEAAVHVLRDALALFHELGDRKAENGLLRGIINEDLIPSSLEGSDSALKAARAALAVCHECDDQRGQAVMLRATFRILLAREKPERALQAAEEALKVYREQEDQRGEAQMMLEMAKVLLQREHRGALQAAKSAASSFHELGDDVGEMAALQVTVDVHAARGDHAMVLEASSEILEKCRAQKDPASEAALLQRVCEVYLEQGGGENAEVVARTAKQAHALAREAGKPSLETSALAALARAHLEAKRPQEALDVAKEAVRHAEDGERRSHIVALQAYGDVCVKLGHPFDAIEAAKEAMEYARYEGLVVQEAVALNTLVDARLANAEPSEALRSAKEAHDRAKRLGNLRAEAAALSCVAKVCLHIKAPAEAIQALDGAQANYKKLKDRKKEAQVMQLAVKAQLLSGDAAEALRAAKEARSSARELRDRRAEAEALDAASQVHLAKRDFNEALDAAKSMAQIYEEIQEELPTAKAKQLLCSVYLAKGDARAAVEMGEDAVALFSKLQDPQEAAALHLVAQAYLQRHHDEERSRQQQGMNRGQISQDPGEAVRCALRARKLFKERGNIVAELEVLDTLARAWIRKAEPREGLGVAEEYLTAAKKARDKPAEANALLVSASALASCQQLAEALRAAETARGIYRDLGHGDGLAEAERFVGVVKDALQELQTRMPVQAGPAQKLGIKMDRQSERPEKSENSLITGRRPPGSGPPVDPRPLYNRKAFPWTPQQAPPKTVGI